jgi:hypothetical protein
MVFTVFCFMFGNKITVLLASMAYFFNCKNPSSNPLQVASSGFTKPPVVKKYVPKKASDPENYSAESRL